MGASAFYTLLQKVAVVLSLYFLITRIHIYSHFVYFVLHPLVLSGQNRKLYSTLCWCLFFFRFALRSNVNHPFASWRLMIFVFSCDSSSPPPCRGCAQAKHVSNFFHKTSKIPTVKFCFKLVKTNVCQSEAKYLAKIFETLIKANYILLCAAEHSHPLF